MDPRRLEELFDALVDLEPADAARRLDESCAGDVALREAVEKLLVHDRAAGAGFLAHPPAVLAEAVLAREPSVVTHPEESAGLGRFAVIRKLGEGGMGTVYMGYDALLDRRVALKLLQRDTVAREWLLREAQALARLSHPNVVAVHEVSEHEGRVFIAMEFVDGQNLREWLAGAVRSVPEVLAMLAQAGRGLAAAHEAGLVHRDFKPENVLVGKDGRARVADFGIAALAVRPGEGSWSVASPGEERRPGASPSALASPLTHRGTLMGTPSYMAPELFLGERATPASDQFAFCVALYTAVYGAPPFAGEDLSALSRSVLDGQFRLPPVRPGIPGWLALILRRGLAREPAERFPSMAALIAALEEHLASLPVRDPEVVRRERLSIAGICIVFILGFCATVLARLGTRLEPGPRDLFFIPVGMIVASIVANVVFRERISRLAPGRRSARLFLVVGPTLLAHRMLALRFGIAPLHIVAVDQLFLAAIFGVAGLTLDWALAAFAVIALAGACVDAYVPERAGAVFVVTWLLAMPLALLRWALREPA
ncbi:serine/threonine-protein kinase [Cystobacter fuscus]|uniref:serine/threonine-protein kinase n=1 Tax=Cystobacter fuscus TaxID=43 RepID=UPI0012FD3B0F|nr:serine/threonine-protein kinase [Cystobacter fuscus]